MSSCRGLFLLTAGVFAAFAPVPARAAQAGPAANVTMVAGNGQVVQVNFPTTVPLTIRVTDSAGIPVGGVPVTWAVTQGSDTGSLSLPSAQTDSNGIATSNFFSTFIQPGLSYAQAAVTATTPIGSITFYETAVPVQGGLLSFQATRLAPDGMLEGVAGQTLPAAVKVIAEPPSGIDNGRGIPNVGVRIVSSGNETDATPPPPPAMCNAPAGIALTGADGVASCDLVLGSTPGTYQVEALVGERGPASPINGTFFFTLKIDGAPACSFTLGSASQNVTADAGTGSVAVTTTSGCSWTATSSANFVTITSGASGTGSGAVNYSVAANTGAARSGMLTVAGQTFMINQAAAAGTPATLSITSGNLPSAVVGSLYSTSLAASGGKQPYTWQVVSGAPPEGVDVTSTGAIAGTPSKPESSTFTVMVKDSAGAMQSQTYTVTVVAIGNGINITNTSFPNGVVGTAYSQQLTYTSTIQCGGPFAPPAVFSIASGSVPGLSVQSTGNGYALAGTPTTAGTYKITLKVADSCGNSNTASYSITVGPTNTATTLMASVPSLTFNVTAVGTSPVFPVTVTSTGGSVTYTIAVRTDSGGSWLGATASSGSTPSTFNVSVSNFASLAQGTYTGSITLTSSDNQIITIPVTLNVGAPPPPGLNVTATTLTFIQAPSMSTQQTLTLSSGGGAVPFAASAQVLTGNATWLSISQTSGTTPANITVTANAGGLPPGTYAGTITLTGGGVVVNVRVNLNVVPTTLSVDATSAAFTYQSGASAPASQTVNLITNGTAIPVTVTTTTAVGGNWLFATQAMNQAISAITISVNPTGLAPGGYSGAVIITPTDASIQPVRIPVTLTVSPGPNPLVTGVTNAASQKPGPISPGEFVTIYGLNMSQATPQQLTLTAANLVATALGGTEVLFDGMPAPLVYVSPTQINAIVPYEVYGKTTTQVQVSYNGKLSTALTLAVVNSAPGIFLAGPPNPTSQAAALNQDLSVNSSANGAPAGSVVSLFATGEGQTNPTGVTGAITTTTLAKPLLMVSATVGGFPANVMYAGSAPGLAEGVLQVNVQIPAGVPHGAVAPVVLIIGSTASNEATIYVAP